MCKIIDKGEPPILALGIQRSYRPKTNGFVFSKLSVGSQFRFYGDNRICQKTGENQAIDCEGNTLICDHELVVPLGACHCHQFDVGGEQ